MQLNELRKAHYACLSVGQTRFFEVLSSIKVCCHSPSICLMHKLSADQNQQMNWRLSYFSSILLSFLRFYSIISRVKLNLMIVAYYLTSTQTNETSNNRN